ncbi:DUF1737 domain-containing protein [Allomuricauda sp. R78024]|uniref:DUF1737 domain-containing protein n=1 Tax=Allomuricauda sp. R78024 TaxID=3093867 RepID=UPI0037CC1F97
MEYKVLNHSNEQQFETLVASYINNGWSLVGGLETQVHPGNGSLNYFQAVTKS